MASSTVSQGVSHADSDVGRVLRNLATKQSMPGFDYYRTIFTFRTVFHTTSFSYCLCKCAFALENVEFIDETGGLNENVFKQVVEYITNGECPHVKNVPREYIQVAKLYAVHVVAAVGGDIKEEPQGHTGLCGGLLKRSLYEIAILRQGEQSYFVQERKHPPSSLMIISKKQSSTEGGSGCVEFKRTEFTSFCIKRNYHQLLVDCINRDKKFGNGMWNIDRALLTALQQNCTDLIDLSE